MDIKKYKYIILIVGISVVLGIGFLVNRYFIRDAPIIEEKRTEVVQPDRPREEPDVDITRDMLGLPQERVPIRAYEVSKTDYHDDLPVVGTIKSIPEISLRFQRNGVIEEFNYKESDSVRKGDIIAVLDKEDALLEVEWARAKIASAKAEANTIKKRLEVMRHLYDTGALIKSRVEEVEAQLEAAERKVDQAEVELRSAQVKLDKVHLYAPKDGILGKKEVEEGEFVTPNDKVISLWDPKNIYAEVGIIEKDIGKVKRGQRARIIVDTYMREEIEFWGVVDQIFPNIEARSRTLTVRARVTGRRAEDLLMPGMFARVRIHIFSKSDAIVVPDTAVDLRSRPPEVSFVEDGKVTNRPVSIEWVGTGYIVIRSGVNVGDIVIVETPGLKKLSTGTPVEIIETQLSVFE